MKNLMITICLFMGQFIFGQECEVNRLSMDNEVVPYVEQFIADGLDRGFYLRSFLINKIDYIYFNPTITDPEVIGFVGEDKRGFYLAPRLRGDSLKLKLTIYHEIGHIIKNSGDHVCYDCNEIMAAYSPKDISVFENEEFWALKLDEYFQWLDSDVIVIQE